MAETAEQAEIRLLRQDVTEIKADVKLLIAEKHERAGAKRLVWGIAGLLGAVSGALAGYFKP